MKTEEEIRELLSSRPILGWRSKEHLMREFRQGGIASRWSERRLAVLLAEYRMFVRQELLQEILS